MLSYRLPARKRALLYSLSVLIIGLALAAIWNIIFVYPRLGLGVVPLFLNILMIAGVVWLLRQLFRTVTEITNTNIGLELTTLPGLRTKICWSDVKVLRSLGLGLTLLGADRRAFVLFSLPGHVTNQLVAILQEASNARIIGFHSV